MNIGEKYVAAAYLVFLGLVLLYVVIYSFRLRRLDRELAELSELAEHRRLDEELGETLNET